MAAYLDMKNCEFYIQDGYAVSGKVNNVSGYAVGKTSITIDGVTGKMETGILVTFAGHSTEYTVSSTTETTGNTTAIVITPALTSALVDDEVVTFGPHRVEITIGEGNTTYSKKKNREYKLNRGLLDQVRNGDEAPLEVSMAFAWTYLSSGTSDTMPTIEEALDKEGLASTWVTTGADCEPYAVDLVLFNKVPSCGAETKPWEKITFPKFRYEDLAHDSKAGLVTVTGKCNATDALKERLASS